MVAAISAVLAASSTPSPDASTAWSKGCFFKMPNLRDEVKRQISKASAWAAWYGIFDALNDQQIRGRTTEIRVNAERGVVGVGLHAIARAIGVNVSTVRRQVGRLEGLGLVVVHRPKLLHVADPATGKITTKKQGRTPPAVVYVTVVEEHLRPFRKGAKCNPSAPRLRVHNATPSKDNQTNQRPPSHRTYGAGGVTAREGRRQEPAKAGGHSAAKAGQEERREPQAFTGAAADAFEATQRRLEAEKAERERNNPPAPYRPQRTPQRTPPPVTPAQAEEDLRQAVAALSPAKRKRCHRLGRKAKAEADKAAAENAMILEIIRKRQERDQAGKAAENDAKAETYRVAYRREKAAAGREAVTA